MRISDWSSDVCSSDLAYRQAIQGFAQHDLARQTAGTRRPGGEVKHILLALAGGRQPGEIIRIDHHMTGGTGHLPFACSLKRLSIGLRDVQKVFARLRIDHHPVLSVGTRSEEHTSELQSLMRTSYAVFCLK